MCLILSQFLCTGICLYYPVFNWWNQSKSIWILSNRVVTRNLCVKSISNDCYLNALYTTILRFQLLYIVLTMCENRERSESHNAKLQRKLEKMNSETEYTLQESKSTLDALEQAREINQKVCKTLCTFCRFRLSVWNLWFFCYISLSWNKNTWFVHIFTRLHNYLNAKRVFRYTMNDVFASTLTNCVINYRFKGISILCIRSINQVLL